MLKLWCVVGSGEKERQAFRSSSASTCLDLTSLVNYSMPPRLTEAAFFYKPEILAILIEVRPRSFERQSLDTKDRDF